MTNNPGLLPYRLGTAEVTNTHWTFIQVFDLQPIIQEFRLLQTKYIKLKDDLKTNKATKFEYSSSYNIISNLENKIDNQINQINPEFTKRPKRAFFNGLGSIIKCLTGNLDQSDAEKYDSQINMLTNNQNKFKTILKDQITLLNDSINNFKETTRNLTHNQFILDSRILQIKSNIKTIFEKEINLYSYFLTHTVLTQINLIFQTIYDVLNKIEVAISFAKLNTLHNSIVKPTELLNEIKQIKKSLIDVRLPFEPTIENILKLENVINIKSYSKNLEVYFILEIPLVENEMFQYYQIHPLPIFQNNTYSVIIPKTKFLILSEHNYMYQDDKCKEVSQNEFLCDHANLMEIQENAPCEVNLIRFSQNVNNCIQIPLQITATQIQKIDNGKYTLVIPKQSVAIQTCNNLKENIPLLGTYVVELDKNCVININNRILKTYKTSKLSFKHIDLPEINTNIENVTNSFNFINMDLNSISTYSLLETQKALSLQSEKLNQINTDVVYVHKSSIWTILLYVILAIVLLYFLYVRLIKPRCGIKKKDEDPQDIIV